MNVHADPTERRTAQRVAVIGAGVSGLTAAWLLGQRHHVTVYEGNHVVGGHCRTVHASSHGDVIPVDMGFFSFNTRSYPNFRSLLAKVGAAHAAYDASFVYHHAPSGREMLGDFQQGPFLVARRHLFSPSWWPTLVRLARLRRDAARFLADRSRPDVPLEAFLQRGGYGDLCADGILAVCRFCWTVDATEARRLSTRLVFEWLARQGLLLGLQKSAWHTVCGGADAYVRRLVDRITGRVETNAAVEAVERRKDCVLVKPLGRPAEPYDAVVIAAHSDQALKLLADPSPAEREVLGAIDYEASEVVLHSDQKILAPVRHRGRTFTYRKSGRAAEAGAELVADEMHGRVGRLQRREASLILSIANRGAIDDDAVLHRWECRTPRLTPAAISAQARYAEINGPRRTFYCGAYWGSGLHEDGVNSALAVDQAFDGRRPSTA